tara:strand:- start:1515 stop:3185 length:1671 start_codon:yes stop_codon:yes gene_type:complete
MEKDKNNITLENINNEFLFSENKSNLNILFNRVAFIFFVFIVICVIYLTQTFHLINKNIKKNSDLNSLILKNHRSDIVDTNGQILAKTVLSTSVGINPNSIIDVKKLILKIKLVLPDLDSKVLEEKIKKKKFFWLRKKIDQEKLKRLQLMGEKSIRFEKQISRVYPHKYLFSHVIGQIDDANKGISGLEKSLDEKLKTTKNKIRLTLDSEIQFLIRRELIRAEVFFKNKGSAAILMNINNGKILSLISLPDFDLNKRQDIKDKKFINRATKAVYELGSTFKTFTLAAGFHENVIQPDTPFLNLKKIIFCGKYPIREYDNKIPSNLTAEEILIRSGNIGSVRIAQKIGVEKYKNFLEKIGILNKIKFDLEEVGIPLPLKWGKCKLATSSYGHGITTTLLQLAKGYSIVTNGGFEINPTLIENNNLNNFKKRILRDEVSKMINPILRKVVSSEHGTASLADVKGYEVGGKTGTAQKAIGGKYSKIKINTFASVFPSSKPKYVLIVMLEDTKLSKDYIYNYRNRPGSYKGTPFNTSGWTSVEITGRIIDNIGPILATKY